MGGGGGDEKRLAPKPQAFFEDQQRKTLVSVRRSD